MTGPTVFHPSPLPRRLILGAAFALALVVLLAFDDTSAEEAKPAPADAPAAAVTKPDAAKPAIEIKRAPERDREDEKADKEGESVTIEKGPSPRHGPTIVVKKDGKTVTLSGVTDREFDSVGQLAEKEPALATMIFGIVAVVFLAPVLAIALILGYRMRKARMLHETMLKLAEKGIVPPAEAFEAVMSNSLPPAGGAANAPVAASLQQQAQAVRARAVWSDLRKGVVMGAIGLALTAHSEMSDSTPSGLGLVLLFVGIGYIALWWFEQRRLGPPGGSAGNERGPGAP